MQHTTLILPMIQSLLDSAGVSLAKLDAIAFGCGPGSFTGIRIAASLAQGLAFAGSLPVIPVSSLAATAQAAYMKHGWQRLLVAVDARMEQIYWGAYQVESSLVLPVFPEEIVTPDAVLSIPEGGWNAVGDGWRVYGAELIARMGREPMQMDVSGLPTAEAILVLAKERYKRKDWVGAAEALPVYLR
jgi:tRNA threonylcarbamoyladenosine biosynthesis protein TsaB